jgi:sarcosine oxidase subunit alpha
VSASPTTSTRREDAPRERLWQVRAKPGHHGATGALERRMVFHGNDRPGVMLAVELRSTYLNRLRRRASATGRRGHQPTIQRLWYAALRPARRGVASSRPSSTLATNVREDLVNEARALGIEILSGCRTL